MLRTRDEFQTRQLRFHDSKVDGVRLGVNAGRHVSLAINVADVLNFSRACIEIQRTSAACALYFIHPEVTSQATMTSCTRATGCAGR